MDDLIVTGSSSDVIEVFKAEMKLKFDMTNLGSLSSYLGIEVKQGRNFIFLTQMVYAQKLLKHVKLTQCNVMDIMWPISQSHVYQSCLKTSDHYIMISS